MRMKINTRSHLRGQGPARGLSNIITGHKTRGAIIIKFALHYIIKSTLLSYTGREPANGYSWIFIFKKNLYTYFFIINFYIYNDLW